jgi:hypothetical protein
MKRGKRMVGSSGMRLGGKHFRFAPRHGAPGALEDRIVEVRQLMRTNLGLGEICERLGVSDAVLRRFIKQRNLCDLKERRQFISRFRMVHEDRPAKAERVE